jgi:PTS system galactitol-specific IIA component
MVNAGLVYDTYPKAVADREKQFPTGLPDSVLAAIPHTTSDHVIKSGIAIAKLRKPVAFYNIANPEEALDIQLIFMLAIKRPEEQLNTLQSLTMAFMDGNIMGRLRNAGTKEDFIAVLDEVGWESNK